MRDNLSDCVIFYGASQHVNELLCAMDVFVLPSIFEGLPFAAIEAQASGLPVLCSEGVSRETHISDHIKALSFEDERMWVNEAINMFNINTDRQNAAEHVKQAGFDVQTVAKGIYEKYMGQEDG